MKTCLIIGGGIGGLVTGALLAKEGYQVTVLEKNALIGGGLQTFKRHGVSFPTGMHIFGGFQEGGNLRKLFDSLGVMDQISVQAMDEDAFDVVRIAEDDAVYRLPKGKERFIAYLSSVFPEEKENIEAYINRLYEITEEGGLFYLRETKPGEIFSFSDDFSRPFDELIDAYFTNPKLKGLMTYLCPLYSGKKGVSPAFLGALLSVLHINGTYQFVGGSQQLVHLLKKIIEDAGGKVLACAEVVKIQVENRQVTEVITKDGNRYHADYYISDVHPDVLLRLVDENAFSKAFKNRINSMQESCSFFVVFVKLKDKAFPYLNQLNYYYEKYNNDVDVEKTSPDDWPSGIIYMTPPVEHQDEFAKTMIFIVTMDYEWLRPWEHTRTGCRGERYELWKQSMIDKVLDRMERLFPDFRNCIEDCFASSPLTIRDYYGNSKGSCYGFQKDSKDPMLSTMSVFTKVSNLYLTGQNINIHGLCGVSLTAIQTAEAIVGLNTIVHKINKKAEKKE